jgi:hypothetical protein
LRDQPLVLHPKGECTYELEAPAHSPLMLRDAFAADLTVSAPSAVIIVKARDDFRTMGNDVHYER